MTDNTEQGTGAIQMSAVLCLVTNDQEGAEPVRAEGSHAGAGYLLTTGAPLQSRSPPGLGAPGSSYTRAQRR